VSPIPRGFCIDNPTQSTLFLYFKKQKERYGGVLVVDAVHRVVREKGAREIETSLSSAWGKNSKGFPIDTRIVFLFYNVGGKDRILPFFGHACIVV
jgi:hypothetical protein